jgi:Domain of unknown function (DUF1707)
MSEHLPAKTGPIRIGDAERDQAVVVLSDHFVAGRLTQQEFEERSDQATQARYADDLSPLFADLPDPAASQPGPRTWSPGFRPDPQRFRAGPPPFLWLAAVVMVGLVVGTVSLAAPGILWVLFWIALFSGPHNNRRWHHPHGR